MLSPSSVHSALNMLTSRNVGLLMRKVLSIGAWEWRRRAYSRPRHTLSLLGCEWRYFVSYSSHVEWRLSEKTEGPLLRRLWWKMHKQLMGCYTYVLCSFCASKLLSMRVLSCRKTGWVLTLPSDAMSQVVRNRTQRSIWQCLPITESA